MKKQVFVAAALVTAMGSALAQSNVTVYGLMDLSVGKAYDKDAIQMMNSYNATTVFGFRGSEDLGGGLKVNFQLEAGGLEADTGAWTKAFDRQSWVGLAGGFGDVMVGRTTTPQNRIMSEYDLNNTAPISSPLKVLGIAANAALINARQSNQIQYATPKLGGFTARVAYAFSEKADNSQRDFLQLAANYKVGQLSLGAAVQPKSQSMQLNADAKKYQTGFMLGARYDLGTFQTSILFARSEQKSKGEGVGIGVSAPFGAWTVGAQYARITSVGAGYSGKGAASYELFTKYNLSKRTYAYGTIGGVNEKARTKYAAALKEKNTFAVGLVHKF